MKRALAIALALSLLPGAALAQPAKKPQPSDGNGVPDFMKARDRIPIEGRTTDVRFQVLRNLPAVRFEPGYVEGTEQIDLLDPERLLRVLADERLKKLWPEIVKWAGEDLESGLDALAMSAWFRLMASMSSSARKGMDRYGQQSFAILLIQQKELYEAYGAGIPDSASADRTTMLDKAITRFSELHEFVDKVDAPPLLRLADAFSAAGRHREPIVLLRAVLDSDSMIESWSPADLAAVRLRIASLLMASGDPDGALAELALGAADGGLAAHAVRFQIARAAILAETGKYAQALSMIDAALAAQAATPETDGNTPGEAAEGAETGDGERIERVDGAETGILWIRACALKGVGRAEEAKRVMAGVRRGADKPLDSARNFEFNVRADLCMGDYEALLADMVSVSKGDAIASPVWLWLQPGRRHFGPHAGRLLTRLRGDPQMKNLVVRRMRVLPPRMTPALNRWRGMSRSELNP